MQYTRKDKYSIPYGDTQESKNRALAFAAVLEEKLKEQGTFYRRANEKHKVIIKAMNRLEF